MLKMNHELWQVLEQHEKAERERKESLKQSIIKDFEAGKIPTPDSVLSKLLSTLLFEAEDILRHHPGAKVAIRLESYRIAYETFKQAMKDLINNLDHFHDVSTQPSFFIM